MKRVLIFLLPAAVLATAALLLAGCHGTHETDKTPAATQVEAQADSTEAGTMEAFYERMREWKALYGWMVHWESEK